MSKLFSNAGYRRSVKSSIRRKGNTPQLLAASRAVLETLETRVLMTSTTWTGATNSDFDTGTNWTNGVPTAGVDATINAGATVTKTSATTDSFASLTNAGSLSLSAGTLDVTGAVSIGGSLTFQGGTLMDATLSTTGGGSLATTASGGTLNHVTLDSNLTISDKTNLTVKGGLTLDATITLASVTGATTLTFANGGAAQSLGGTGEISFGGTFSGDTVAVTGNTTSTSALTIGSNITVDGETGTLLAGDTGGNAGIINDGLISADISGGTITVAGTGTIDNTSGTMSATAGGTLVLDNIFTSITIGKVTSLGGTLDFEGSYTGNLTLNSTTGGWNLYGGTIKNSTITFSAADKLNPTTFGGTLDNDVLDSSLTLNDGSTVEVQNGLTLNNANITLNSVGSNTILAFNEQEGLGAQSLLAAASTTDKIIFGGTSANNQIKIIGNTSPTSALTIGSGITIDGGSGSIVAGDNAEPALINDGTISADLSGTTITINGTGSFDNTATATLSALNGGTLTINAANWTNEGTINEVASTINLGGTFTALGTVTRTAGTINLTGIDIVNGPFALNATTGTFRLVGGTIRNAVITLTGGAALTPTTSGGTLDNDTLSNDITIPNAASMTVVNGLVLNANINIASTDTNVPPAAFTTLTFNDNGAPQTLSGTGSINFGATATPSLSGNRIIVTGNSTANAALTIGPNIKIHGATGEITAGNSAHPAIVNDGTIAADQNGETITIDGSGGLDNVAVGGTFTTPGTLSATNGATLTIMPATWSSEGTLIENASKVNLGGAFSVLNPLTRTSGTVNLTGVYTVGASPAAPVALPFSASTGNWFLLGGTLANANITFAGGASLIPTTVGGTLSGDTLTTPTTSPPAPTTNLIIPDGTSVTVTNGLTFNLAKISIEATQTDPTMFPPTTLFFDNTGASQTVSGSGQILFSGTALNQIVLEDNSVPANHTLTLGSGVIIDGGFGTIDTGTDADPSLINKGTISADVSGKQIAVTDSGSFDNQSTGTLSALNGGELNLNPGLPGPPFIPSKWTNEGTINVDATSTVDLGGAFSNPGTITRPVADTGTINLTGIYSVNGALAFNATTGSWRMDGGALVNAVLSFTGGNSLVPTPAGGILGNNTLNSNLTIPDSARLGIQNGLTLNNTTITLDSTGTNNTVLNFDQTNGSQTLGGTGEIIMGGTATHNLIDVTNTSDGTLTIGANILIDGAAGTIDAAVPSNGVDAGDNPGDIALINNGTIAADTTKQSIIINQVLPLGAGETVVTNNGIFEADPGTLQINGDFNATGGTLEVGIGGTNPGVDFGQINFVAIKDATSGITTGAKLTMGGTLAAALLNGYTPPTGTMYTVLNYTSRTGSFATLHLSPPGAVFTAQINATTTVLTGVPAGIVTTAMPATAAIGTSIADQATVNGTTPTGTVTYNLYNNPTGTGTPLFTDMETLSGGMATSKSYTPAAIGTYYWVDSYSGDTNNPPSTSGVAAEPVNVTAATPTIATLQQPASATVGASIADKATISGGFSPTGTVTFRLYNNATGTGTPLFTDTESLSSGTATSAGYATTAVGTDYWVDTYNGDSNNNTVTSGVAAEPVVISLASPTIGTTQQPSTAGVGSSIADNATVSGGANPTGTVTFNLYNNPTGTGTPLFTDTEALSSGTATSKSFIPSATGTDYWVDTYNGDSNNNSVTSGVAAEPVVISLATPTIGTTQQPSTAVVGTSIADKATLTGGSNPTGTITFDLFSNSTATGTPLFTDTETLAAGTATSKGYSTTATGTDYWVATYNGDSNNATVSGGDAAEPVTVTPANPTIGTTQQPATAVVGTSIADKASITGGFNPTGTVTFDLYSNATATGTPLFIDTETLAAGTATSKGYSTTVTGTDYWVATYNGDSNNATVSGGDAAEPVTVTTASPTIATTQEPTTAAIGSSIADSATLNGGSNPTGTVTFNLYNNATATGTPLFTDTETLSGGSATSKGYTAAAIGTDYWVDTYNGDANNNGVTSGPAAEPVTVTIASPTVVTTQQPASATVGASIADKATISGGDSPTGTVTFDLYNNSTATGTPLFTDTETLSGGAATSKGFTTSATGTDYWVDTYSGDANNNGAASGDAAEPVIVSLLATPTIATTQQPSSATAGSSIADKATISGGNGPTGTVTFDLYNNATATGTPLFTDTETLSGGAATSKGFTATAAGTDYWVDTYNGDSNNNVVTSGDAAEPVTVNASTATHFSISAPSGTTAGSPLSVTVSALDQYGNVVTGYSGTVQFSSSDSQATLPANYTFTPGDDGVHTFTNGVTLDTAGIQTVSAKDNTTSITGSTSNITVTAAAATHYSVTAPVTTPAGSGFGVTVTTLDQYDNVATGYRGTVHFTTSDTGSGVALPADYTFTPTDSGVHSFTGVTLVTAGTDSITATDTVTNSITGSANVIITAATATHYSVTAPPTATAGTAFSITVAVLDQYGNVATGYQGTVHFTSTDGSATLPPDYTFVSGDNGVHTFTSGVTLVTDGSQTVTATDTNTSSITGKTGNITVSAASPTIGTTQQPATASVGASIADKATLSGGYNPSGTVTFDLYNNSTATGTPLFTDTETLSAGTATSKGYTTTATGTDYWVDTYSGNSDNNGATSGLAAEPVVVSTMATPVIATTQQPGSTTIGLSIADKTAVGSGSSPTGTVTFKLYNNSSATGTPLFTDTETLTAGTSDTIAASPTGATESGATVTITTTTPHGLIFGDTVTIAGVGVAGYDGTFTIVNAPSPTTFTYTDITGLASSGGGTATGAAVATSKGYTTAATGTDYWVDTYNGDSNNFGVSSGDTAEPVTVNPAVVIFPGSLPSDTIDVPYNRTLSASGGTGAIGLAVTNIQNPIPGLNVPVSGPGSLTITGTPTATGTEMFTVTATDSVGATTATTYSITVNPAIAISPPSLPADTINVVYNQTLSTSGGTGAIGLQVTNVQNAIPGLNVPLSGTGSLAITGTPTATGTEMFTVTATDSVGATTATSYSITVNPVATGDTIFQPTAAPAPSFQSVGDPAITAAGGVDLGIKFTSDVAGTVTGVRFYKGSLETGTQMGELWSNTGTLLASVTFSGESASGWQQAEFSSPVLINANTIYIIAYHTTSSFIAYTPGGLTTGVDNPPLHALANGVSGGDGVYHYDSTPGNVVFPNQYNGHAPNYWVDVVFSPAPVPTDSIFSPTAAPASNLQNVNDPAIISAGGVDVGIKFTSDVSGLVDSVRFYKGSLDKSVHIGELWSMTGTLLDSVTFTGETASGWQQANFATPVAITANTSYIVAYHTTSGTIAYTAGGLSSSINNSPLHALASGASGGNGVYHYDFIPGTPAFPNVYNGQSPNYWVDVVFTPSTTLPPVTIFSPTSAPATPNVFDPNIAAHGGVDVGIKFTSDVAGLVDGVRFYEGSQDTGVQIGELWSNTGTLLATATFTAETGSGWQQVSFSSPVAISANTVYIIAYHTTAPFIAYTPGGLSSGIDNPPLHALANGVSGGDGVYSYDVTPGTPVFPSTYNGQAPNYWVDVVFSPS